MTVFQVLITVPSPLPCWGLYWSLPCWEEQPGLRIRRMPCVFEGFPPSEAFITDNLEHIQTQMEMCWSQTWVHILGNSTQRLFFKFSVTNTTVKLPAFSLCLWDNPRERAWPSPLNAFKGSLILLLIFFCITSGGHSEAVQAHILDVEEGKVFLKCEVLNT